MECPTKSPCYCDYSKTFEARQEHQLTWAKFLDRWTWDWFCTFTFRGDRVHPEQADKKFHYFIGDINRTLRGRNWYKHGDGVRWVRALEMQKRGVIHYHALIGGVGVQDLRRLTYKDKWEDLAGFARIEPIRSSSAVRCYVSKYVLKDGEIELGGPLRYGDGPLLKDAARFGSPEPRGERPGQKKPALAEILGQVINPALGFPS